MTDKFIPKLINAIDWAGKISGWTLVIGFTLWKVGAFPFIGDMVEKEFREQDLFEQVSKNTVFRECWPVGKCDDIVGLPVDGNQNASIVNLAEAYLIISDYVKENCQVDIVNGDDRYDCKRLSLPLKIYVK